MTEPVDEQWRKVLSGEIRFPLRDLFRSLPTAPRCKLCAAPFRGPVSVLLKPFGFRRWMLNQQMCTACIGKIRNKVGGAEVDVSLVYADVRGSTGLGEKLTPEHFSRLMNGFYDAAARTVDEHDGVIDHVAGDGMMAMWIPAFSGSAHVESALAAATGLVERVELDGLPVGAGVHTGVAYVGVVGSESNLDFTVLGDTANTVARIGSAAHAGEVLASLAVVSRAGLEDLTTRTLTMKGKEDPVEVAVVRPAAVPPAAV
jgi:adenylate cyclase